MILSLDDALDHLGLTEHVAVMQETLPLVGLDQILKQIVFLFLTHVQHLVSESGEKLIFGLDWLPFWSGI